LKAFFREKFDDIVVNCKEMPGYITFPTSTYLRLYLNPFCWVSFYSM